LWLEAYWGGIQVVQRVVHRVAEFVVELRRRKVFRAAGMYLVMAFVVVQVVDAVFPLLPLPESAGTLVLELLAIGFPIAVGLAWALELTPVGLRRELTKEQVAAINTVGASDPTRVRPLRRDSIAVLPFENLTTDLENEYFSDGITEDIIASIARIRGLRVLSRTSVLQYKDSRQSLSSIARELGVGTIVTGTVRRSGWRTRIVARVVDAEDESHLWSDTYDRDLEDVFQVQSEVAAQVAGVVQRELSASERSRIELRGTTDPEAYDLYLRARFLWNARDRDAVVDSIELFRQALERDPTFTLAHAGLADAHTVLGIYGTHAPSEVFPAAKESLAAALAIDPKLGEALASQACIAAIHDWDWQSAEDGFKRAIELSPSYATAHQWYAMNVLSPQGRFEDAIAALDRASRLDPASMAIAVGRGIVRFYARDYDRAIAELEEVEALHPRFSRVHYFLAQCHAAEGRMHKSVAHTRQAVDRSQGSSESLAVHAHVLARCGNPHPAEQFLDKLLARAERGYVSHALVAQVMIGLGRPEDALGHLERAAEARATDLIWLGIRPVYDPLRGMARFEDLIDRMGLATR
jgi:TolB-like protein/tetratricopeptide (TPR) repeat protein